MSHIAKRDVNEPTPESRLVWDLPVRVTHWALVFAVAGCWATHYAGIEWFGWHRRFGYAVLVLVAFRIAWGLVGTRHARFASFVRGPRTLLAHLWGRGRATAGHNPLGGLSVIALLALLLLQAATGLFANDEIMNMGPFYGWIAPGLSNRITSLHRASSDWLLALIGLHVAAVAFYVRYRRQPLVRAMVTGRKPASQVPAAEAIAGSRVLLALVIVAALAVLLALAVRAAPEGTIALY
jgi:cytochrome b